MKSWDAALPGSFGDYEVNRTGTALVVVDMQYFDASPVAGLGARFEAAGLSQQASAYFQRLGDTVIPNIARLQEQFRKTERVVANVRITHHPEDQGPRTWRYRALGILIPPDSQEAEFIPELAPADGELVFDKTTSSLFNSTRAEEELRERGIDTLVVTGVATNNCVETTVRDAADLGFRVILVDDCCATLNAQDHERTIVHLGSLFARVVSTDEVLEEMARADASQDAGSR